MSDVDINNSANRSGQITLKDGLNSLLNQYGNADEIAKKAFRIAKVSLLFKQCMEYIYGSNAFFILEKTNAIYIFKERDKGLLKKPLPQDKTITRMVIYVSDSMVHADLDSRQEFIKHWFHKKGQTIDKYDILTSKLGMRRRHPFDKDVAEMKKQLGYGQNGVSLDLQKEINLTETDKARIYSELEKIENTELKQAIKKTIRLE